jgi:hypothetical protein
MDDLHKLRYCDENPIRTLDDYENVNIAGFQIFQNIPELIQSNPNIISDDNVLIHFINGVSGFGSQITIFMQILYYFNEVYPKVTCLPHFSNNNTNFKYHDKNYNNSFFLYYKRRIPINDIQNYKQYAVHSHVIGNYPFFENVTNIRKYPANDYIQFFFKNYEFIIDQRTTTIIDNIRCQNKPLFGIHIRSIYQKNVHAQDYLSISINDRIRILKEKIDKNNTDYLIFAMSDVAPYIETVKSIFPNVYYFENVKRIDNDYTDIICVLNDNECGYKLGMDILTECYAMSMCDKIFVSNSNIPAIISTMTPDIEFEEY